MAHCLVFPKHQRRELGVPVSPTSDGTDLAPPRVLPRPLMLLILHSIAIALAACAQTERGVEARDGTAISWACEPLPASFDTSDLVGEWEAEYGDASRLDRLVIREDGTCSQIFYDSHTDYRYVSGENRWRVEQRASGGLYVHVEGMLFCDLEEECVAPETQLRDGSFFDTCERQRVVLRGELILAVVGDQSYPGLPTAPRGIALLHMRPPGREGPPFRFVLALEQEQALPEY